MRFSFLNVFYSKYFIYRYCRGSICDESKVILGSCEKRAQTISFVERGFERLGFGHRMVGRVGSSQLTSSKESGELYALVILLVSRTPWLGGLIVLPSFLDCLFFLLY